MNATLLQKKLKIDSAFKEIITGLSDGLSFPFALAAGLSSFLSTSSLIVWIGLAQVTLASIAMAIGGYFTSKEEFDVKVTDEENITNANIEAVKNKVDEKQNKKNAFATGVVIGIAYVAGGIIALLPYLFIERPMDAFKVSAIVTLLLLIITGYIRSKIYHLNTWSEMIRPTLIAALAAAAAFGVGTIVAGE